MLQEWGTQISCTLPAVLPKEVMATTLYHNTAKRPRSMLVVPRLAVPFIVRCLNRLYVSCWSTHNEVHIASKL